MLKVATVLVCTVYLANSARMTTQKANSMARGKDLMTSGSDDGMAVEKEPEMMPMPDLMGIMNDCNDTFRIEMGYLESLSDSGSFPDENDKTPKCFVNCVLENTEIASDDGQFDVDMAARTFSKDGPGKQMDAIQAIAVTCNENRMEFDKCIRSYMFMKCLMESDVRTYMKIM